MNMPCTPIPCPQFEDVEFTDVRPIGWQGVNIPYLEPAPEFTERPREQQVADIIEAVRLYADECRTRYRYSLDTLITVGLPVNSSLADVLEEVRATEVDGVMFTDAR